MIDWKFGAKCTHCTAANATPHDTIVPLGYGYSSGLWLPVHDDSMWDVDRVQIPPVVFRIGEEIHAVPRPGVWDLSPEERLLAVAMFSSYLRGKFGKIQSLLENKSN